MGGLTCWLYHWRGLHPGHTTTKMLNGVGFFCQWYDLILGQKLSKGISKPHYDKEARLTRHTNTHLEHKF